MVAHSGMQVGVCLAFTLENGCFLWDIILWSAQIVLEGWLKDVCFDWAYTLSLHTTKDRYCQSQALGEAKY